jgi:hypothetical protein
VFSACCHVPSVTAFLLLQLSISVLSVN